MIVPRFERGLGLRWVLGRKGGKGRAYEEI